MVPLALGTLAPGPSRPSVVSLVTSTGLQPSTPAARMGRYRRTMHRAHNTQPQCSETYSRGRTLSCGPTALTGPLPRTQPLPRTVRLVPPEPAIHGPAGPGPGTRANAWRTCLIWAAAAVLLTACSSWPKLRSRPGSGTSPPRMPPAPPSKNCRCCHRPPPGWPPPLAGSRPDRPLPPHAAHGPPTVQPLQGHRRVSQRPGRSLPGPLTSTPTFVTSLLSLQSTSPATAPRACLAHSLPACGHVHAFR